MNKKQIDILNDFFLHTALHLMTLEEQSLRRVCSEDLSVRELHVIEAVSSLEQIGKNTMAEIAKYLRLSPASLTTAVNVLVKKHYLQREYSAYDRRVIFVKLTESGKESNRKYLDFVRNMIYNITKNLDEESADSLIESLMKLREFLESDKARDISSFVGKEI